MSGAVGRVLAPLAALALVVLLVSLVGGSDLLAGVDRPEGPETPETSRTTIIYLTEPGGNQADAGAGAGAGSAGGASVSAPGSDSSATAGSEGASTGGAASGATGGAASSTTGSQSTGVSTDPAAQETTYTVQAGDTPYSIGLAFGVSTQELMRANGISDPTNLQVGTVLVIPAK
ncbi:MAG TPA: LysM peptidoglycan-binding domain-containing protein [Thermoleophilia bacterium]|nr:LysM peptidoglycan-binding domain-containing protein [Thermoleophilia bacterium]